MSSTEYLSSKNRLFRRLQQVDKIVYSREPLLEFKFLDTFVILQSFTDEPNMLDITQKVQILVQDAAIFFTEANLHEYFSFYNSKLQKRIWSIKMEIRAKYSFPKISVPPSANIDGITFPRFVLTFIDTMVDNLCSLRHVSKNEEHDKVLMELKMLRAFVFFVSERIIEPQSGHVNFFAHVLAVAGDSSMLSWLYCHTRWCQELAPEEIYGLIKPIQPCMQKIYVNTLKALKLTMQSACQHNIQNEHAADSSKSDFVRVMHQNKYAINSAASFVEFTRHNLVALRTNNSNSSQRVYLKDNLAILQKMLNLLGATIIHVPMQDLGYLLRGIDTVAIDVGLLVYSVYEREVKEDVALAKVLDMSGNIQHINTMIYLTIRKASQSNLPRIHGLGYVDFLLNNLKKFQCRYANLFASVTNELQIIQKVLESLLPFLEAIAVERHNDLDKIQRYATQLIGKAYEVEYIVDACISKEAPVWCLKRWLLDIIEEIIVIKIDVADIQEKNVIKDTKNTVTAHMSSNLTRSPRMNEEIVGFEEVIEKLRDQLINGTKGRDVISIVGMPGLGKTTLAYRLYSDRCVASHFDIRVQCCVSQVYSRKDLLLEILREATGEDSKRREKCADHLADELHKTLFSKRYLVFIDDIWKDSTWDDLIGCFQDANNGSRIILTTRNHEVANYTRFQTDPLPLRMFNDDESWQLLKKKVFGEESCSSVLTNIGQQIAKKCGQLPLSVALVAGILVEMERKEECWEQVANNLGTHIYNDSRVIIDQSYQILPYHLRPCFLYFGAFLEDSVINVSKLTRLWISEGLIKSCEGKSLEDIAEDYLENLIGRNLVMGTKSNYGDKIKSCRIHDLLHDFCKERAKEENFILWITRENANPSSSFYSHKQLAHRMSIYGEGNQIGEWSSSWSLVGSVILHDDCLATDHVLSRNFYNLKFLKVLNLEFALIRYLPTDLVYLRYFAAKCHGLTIPSSIGNLRNLETLILIETLGPTYLPLTFWKMIKLRHLHVTEGRFKFNIENAKTLLENSTKRCDLVTLSSALFYGEEDAELMLRKTPHLRKLRCEFKGVDKFQYQVFNFPTQLETLKIRVAHPFSCKPILFCISAPNLKKLTLFGCWLDYSQLSNIGLLQNLLVLKLESIGFDIKEWEVSNDKFPQLQVLKLERVGDFGEWTVADNAFPYLERLVLRQCDYLKKIPSCFEHFCSLKSIVVFNCKDKSVAKSAWDIRKAQVEDYQNSGFEVFIHE